MIRRKYEFTEDKKAVDEQDSLMHYGRKGMKWYKNIFSDTADRLGKAAENLKNDKKYDVSKETKDIAAGKYGKKEDSKTDDDKKTTTKVGGASSGATEKKEEKSELDKLKEENEKLKQQLTQAQQTTTTTTTRPAQQQAQPQQQSSPAIKAKSAGEPISAEKEVAKDAAGISSPAKPIKVPSSVVNNISDAQAEALKKVGIEVRRDSDTTTKETSESKTNNTNQNDQNVSKKLEETVNKTNELSQQLKRSEERITLLEELLKKYEKR